MKNKVVSLNAVRQMKELEAGDSAYRAWILKLGPLELLEEMIRFQEERSRQGGLTLALIIRGQALFQALEKIAETKELRQLAKSYRRHLKYELEAHSKNFGAAQ
jgi:hypothetical protein